MNGTLLTIMQLLFDRIALDRPGTVVINRDTRQCSNSERGCLQFRDHPRGNRGSWWPIRICEIVYDFPRGTIEILT